MIGNELFEKIKSMSPEQFYNFWISVFSAYLDPVKAAGGCRCGECVHYEKGKDYTPYCNHFNGIAQANEADFCSYGELKEI